MSFGIFIRPEAESDLEEAAIWYEKQRRGLGGEFIDEVRRTVRLLTENPYLYHVVHQNIRSALIRRFPFATYYLIEQKTIIVISVMHGSRDPKRWRQRV